jgi:hypothetical protein
MGRRMCRYRPLRAMLEAHCTAARRAREDAAEALKGAEQVVMLKWLNVEVPGGSPGWSAADPGCYTGRHRDKLGA